MKVPSPVEANVTQLDLFRESLPKKPYCSNDLRFGLKIRPANTAAKHLYIEPNDRQNAAWLVFDVDRPTASIDWQDRHVAPPNWIAMNPDNGHAHLGYGLKNPVWLQFGKRDKAFRYLAAVDAGMTEILEADPGYSKLICKNPLRWDHWTVTLYQPELYDLGWLADYLPELPYLKDARRKIPDIGYGRNCNLFELVRKWAYRKIREPWLSLDMFEAAVAEYAHAFNVMNFARPLPYNEVANTSKSIAKWTWNNLSPAGWREWGDNRRAKSIRVRKARSLDRALELQTLLVRHPELTQTELARLLGINQGTVSRLLRAPYGATI